ncbi:uncharacterized protein A4U43_C05F2450 [Asparagus officinalis]|uniref:DYW domain-containing protein n=1 Tax=Asparagus officinalis TaxID=4686 RepID=A0A5P1EPF0_ASPOF|nr:pentatricopeptide repeat-containing protein At2g22070-like [Asparagus officinalis]ONK67664.1 uncharacterized protein A4U43_C05F2450 [Asparagus officinalis]
MASAEKVFDEMPVRNLVSWNSLVAGFVRNRIYGKAIMTFRGLLLDGEVGLDQVSLSSVLSACANSGELGFGRQVHARGVKAGADGLAYVENALIDMYLKCRCTEEARVLFESMEERDVVSWNIVMMGSVQNEHYEEVCKCFSAMRRDGIRADIASFSTVLQALWCIASWGQGATIHAQIVKAGYAMHCSIGSPLITMYAKCGSLADAYRYFEEINNNLSVVSWTAMIAAYQQHGHGDRATELFNEMLEKGIEPDYITFICVLSACSHKGLIDQGFRYFDSMSKIYNIVAGHEHYACIVDMLGRAGKLEEAKKFVDNMPIKPDASVWGALLGACSNRGELEMGEKVAQKLFEIEPDNSGNYVLLSNMYAYHGKLEEAKEVRRLMGCKGVRKETGCSWIDVKNKTYIFVVQDRSHSRTKEIYAMLRKLEDLVKEKGYVADTRFAVNDVDGYKEQGLWYHSERLALAFGLISLPADAPIRIKKNLRTCVDCHGVMKLVSGILQREIVIRDINRFHRFAHGSCSCGDYW